MGAALKTQNKKTKDRKKRKKERKRSMFTLGNISKTYYYLIKDTMLSGRTC